MILFSRTDVRYFLMASNVLGFAFGRVSERKVLVQKFIEAQNSKLARQIALPKTPVKCSISSPHTHCTLKYLSLCQVQLNIL